MPVSTSSKGSDGHHSPSLSHEGANENELGGSSEKTEFPAVAIIGMDIRFPGNADTVDSFWEVLLNKQCTATEIPKERFNLEAFYNSDPESLNTIYSREAHFLKEGIWNFDASFFSLAAAEVTAMDPQSRILLETTYRALENAGIRADDIRGSKTSVHVGCFTNDFQLHNYRDIDQIPKYSATGTSSSMLANRISWQYDLKGPSLTVDTACSSGMTALDLACQALNSGESEMAIVAGANLITSPELHMAISNMNFLSPDGRSFSFDDRANGYSRGDGFAVLVLKRVNRAINDGDTLRAVIRSIGTNQDGFTAGGITQPSRISQAELIKDTYRKANLDMSSTRFFEAHGKIDGLSARSLSNVAGTGTALGDPTEARAIGESFRQFSSETEPLYIGAAKSNIGHLEGTSGLAGIVKAVLALEKGLIPPNTSFERLNPRIDAQFLHFAFPLDATPWPCEGLRRASINCFGFGGSNAHTVLDDAYHYLKDRHLPGRHVTVSNRPSVNGSQNANQKHLAQSQKRISSSIEPRPFKNPKVIFISAEDEHGVDRIAKGIRTHMEKYSVLLTESDVDDLAYTLNVRRTRLTWRSFAVVSEATSLDKFDEIFSRPVRATPEEKHLGFAFTGQGAQWFAMGRELHSVPIFYASLSRSQKFVYSLGCNWSLIDELLKSKDESRVNKPEYSQTLCCAVQIALVDLFRTLGILPSIVVGHSSGEIAAAYCAGYLSHHSAIKAAYHRGALTAGLSQKCVQPCTMMAVGLSKSGTLDEIAVLGKDSGHAFDANSVTISCVNSPTSVTVAGPVKQIQLLETYLHKRSKFARRLQVNAGYHSPQMQIIASEYLAKLGNLEPDVQDTGCQMVSSVTCQFVSASDVCRGSYWIDNLVSPVDFNGAVGQCSRRDKNVYKTKKLDKSHKREVTPDFWVELGPHSALQGPLREILSESEVQPIASYTSALMRNQPASVTLLKALGQLVCRGFKVDTTDLNQLFTTSSSPKLLTDLPPYPFDHSTAYRQETLANEAVLQRKYRYQDALGHQAGDWNPLEPKWRFIIKTAEMEWALAHKVNGVALYPAAGMLVMAIEAARLLCDTPDPSGYELKDVEFHAPIIVQTTVNTEMHISLHKSDMFSNGKSTGYHFRIHCHSTTDGWVEACSGNVRADFSSPVPSMNADKLPSSDLGEQHERAASRCFQTIESTEMYERLRHIVGLDYGPAFQVLGQIAFNDEQEAVATIRPLTWLKSASEKNKAASSARLHPTTFDGIFQLMFAALTRGQFEGFPTMVPTRLDYAWISNERIGQSETNEEHIHVRAQRLSRRTAHSSFSVVRNSDQQCQIRIDKLTVTAVTTGAVDFSQALNSKSVPFSIDWKADLDMLSNHQVQTYCQEATMDSDPVAFFQDWATLVLTYAAQALQGLRDQQISPVPSLRRYASWLENQLTVYTQDPTSADVQGATNLIHNPDKFEALCDRLKGSYRAEFYMHVGQNLKEVLQGSMDPLQLLFSDPALTTGFYEEVNSTSRGYKAAARFLEASSHKNPAQNILEIGAGTASTTTTLLPAITSASGVPRFNQYVFTDISPAFLASAQQQFATQEGMQYQVLNIEKDPFEQGFESEQFDLVIAAAVLHATADLTTVLTYVRKLLKPGGKLLIMEPTVPQHILTAFAWGMLPGWWLGSEDYRQLSPCVTEDHWASLLKGNGFSGVDHTFRDFQSSDCHQWSIMMSTAEIDTAPLVTLSSQTESQATIIINHQSGLPLSATEALQKSFDSASIGQSWLNIVDAAALLSQPGNLFIILDIGEHSILEALTSEILSALKTILTNGGKIIWVNQGGGRHISRPHFGTIQGLTRVLRHEHPGIALFLLALESSDKIDWSRSAVNVVALAKMVEADANDPKIEHEYREMDGLLHFNRLVQADEVDSHIRQVIENVTSEQIFAEGPPKKLALRTPGIVDSMEFIEDESVQLPLQADEIEIDVKASGINFKDCLTMLGRVADSDDLGSECSGIIRGLGNSYCGDLRLGDRVAILGAELFRSRVRAQAVKYIKIPENMSFTDAAAIPTVFVTAYWSLCDVARLSEGETILIHTASGGTGQAAIQIAKHLKAEVFVTVGSPAKKQHLIDYYSIPEDHIFHSRDTSFAKGIRDATGGRGVDVILNTLSGNALVASWELIAPYGRFIDIGRNDIDSHRSLPMHPFGRGAGYHGFNLADLNANKPAQSRKVLERVFELVQQGVFHAPAPTHIYQLSEIQQAFKSLQSGQNMGKIVLEFNGEAVAPTADSLCISSSMHTNGTYMIAGGLGGVGRGIARWLASRGAKHLILLSRSGPDGNDKAKQLIEYLEGMEVQVACPVCDVTDLTSLQKVLEECSQQMPPIKGCIQASMVLQDTTFLKMTLSDWDKAIKPKVTGSWNLHLVLPKDLDFYIMLSSTTGIIGHGGQSNYAAGNTFQDALAEYRTSRGEKATTIDLGVVLDDGMVAEDPELLQRLLRKGYWKPMPFKDVLLLLDFYCDPARNSPGQFKSQVVTGLELPADLRLRGDDIPPVMREPSFRIVDQMPASGQVAVKKSDSGPDTKTAFVQAESVADAEVVAADAFKAKLSRILGIPIEGLGMDDRMQSYGIDSLVAVELRNWLGSELGADVAVFEIVGNATIRGIGQIVTAKSSLR